MFFNKKKDKGDNGNPSKVSNKRLGRVSERFDPRANVLHSLLVD
jgi:hypothetical protein